MTGRPVDIEIVPRAHAILSASSADRWITCTPSARIEEALEDEESSFATDGTAAHALAELRLRWKLGQITKAEYVAGIEATRTLYAEAVGEWDHSDWEAIDSYVEYVLAEHKRIGGTITVEARVDYSRYAEQGFGTSDALLVNIETKIAKSIDLKFGKGVPVSAVKNSQARLYALGGFLGTGINPDRANVALKDWTVEWAIHQPRLDYVGEDGEALVDLLTWAEEVVAPAAALAWKGEGKKVPSDKACQFCKAKAVCRERAAVNVNVAMRDFMGDPDYRFDAARLDEHVMGMDEVARILPNLDEWIAWANAMKKYALESVRDRGAEIDGYKLVRGRSMRRWSGSDDKIAATLKAEDVSGNDIYEQPEPRVRSVAQMEKHLGKKRFAELNDRLGLVVTPPGTPALVPDADPRDAIDAAAEARKDFA